MLRPAEVREQHRGRGILPPILLARRAAEFTAREQAFFKAKDIALANYEDWNDAERVFANVAAIYREFRGIPASEGLTPMEVFAGMAELFKHQKTNGTHGHHGHAH